MTTDELVAFLEAKCQLIVSTIRDKNADYTGGHADPFFNFRAVDSLEVCDIEVGMLTRLSDKFMRVRSFVKQGVLKVKTETVTDTLVDAAGYSLLLAAVIEEKRRKAEVKAPMVAKSTYVFDLPIVRGGLQIGQCHADLTKRADQDFLMVFHHPNVDSIRGKTANDVLGIAIEQFGICRLLESASS